MQQKDYEKQKRAAEEAKRKAETRERDPLLFPFEEYFFFDLAAARGGELRGVERALALPPGEYDVYVGLIDRARIKTSSAADRASDGHGPGLLERSARAEQPDSRQGRARR